MTSRIGDPRRVGADLAFRHRGFKEELSTSGAAPGSPEPARGS